MAQADNFPSVTAKDLLRIQSKLYGIFGDKVDLGQFYLHTHTHTHPLSLSLSLSLSLQFSCVSILPPGLLAQYFVHLQSTLHNPSKRQLCYLKHSSLSSKIFTTTLLFFGFVYRASRYICVIKTNLMQYLS